MIEITILLSITLEVIITAIALSIFAAMCLSFTAFGFAMVMVPTLSMVWDVKSAVVTAIILATTTNKIR